MGAASGGGIVMKKFKITMEDLYALIFIGTGIASLIYIIYNIVEWTS